MTFNKVMTVSELLRWAYEETVMADSLERIIPDLPWWTHTPPRTRPPRR